jgi:hypothetical protein
MREFDLFEFLREAIFPLLLFGLFTAICVTGAVKAIRRKRQFRKAGHRVTAEILSFRKETRPGRFGRYKEQVCTLTVRCQPPEESGMRVYMIESFAGRASRYAECSEAEVCFIPGEAQPVLREDMTHVGLDSVLGIFGALLCGFMSLLYLILIIDTACGGRLSGWLSRFFMRHA